MNQIHSEDFINKIKDFNNSFENEHQNLQINLQISGNNQINIPPAINKIYTNQNTIHYIKLFKDKLENFITFYNSSIATKEFKIKEIEEKIKGCLNNIIVHYNEIINKYHNIFQNKNISPEHQKKLEPLIKKYDKIYIRTAEDLIDEIKILTTLLISFVDYLNKMQENVINEKKNFEDIFKGNKLKDDELNHKMFSSYSNFLRCFEKIRSYLEQIGRFISKRDRFKKLRLIQKKINEEIISNKIIIVKFDINKVINNINLFEQIKQNNYIKDLYIPDIGFEQIKFNILFIFDITSSMGKYIEQFKKNYFEMIENLKNKCPLSLLYLGFIGYKDISDLELGDEYIDIDFTLLYGEIYEKIKNIQAEGGDDVPEDVSGAFEMALKKSWNQGTNIIFLITDSPCHGTKYHDLDQNVESLKDRFKDETYDDVIEEFRRKNIEKLVEEFVERNFNLICLNIHDNTKKMFNMFEDKYNSKNKNNLFSLSDKNLDKCIIEKVSELYAKKEEEILNQLKSDNPK